MTSRTNKAKRKLSDIDFSKDGCHVALTSKQQQGPANGHDYALILKANKFSQEFVEKVQQVQVTLELPDFLKKFFNLYYEDAEVLARMMGYVKEETTDQVEFNYEDYIQEKVNSFTLLKSLHENIGALSELDEDQFLSVRKAQAELEKVLEKNSAATADEGSTEAVVKAKESDDVNQAKVDPSGENQTGNTMENEIQMVEKSAFESVQKALDDTKVELQKALDALAAVEAEKKEAVRKSKLAVLKDAVKEDKYVDALSKAALTLEAEEFDGFVAVVKELANKIDNSALFTEQGVTSQEENTTTESPVAKALKAQNIVK
jgi:hypothetical protein